MKKIIVLSLFFALMLAGCGKQQQNANNAGNTGDKPAPDNQMRRRPDFGQPEEDADFSGFVKNLVGNEAVILKIERPEGNWRENGENEENGEAPSDEERTERRAQALSFSGTGSGGRMPGMGGRRPGSFTRNGNGEIDEATRAAIMERIKEMAVGEEKVLIPVGIRMLKLSMEEENKLEAVEATLEDIKENTMLRIWLDDSVEDRNVAEFVFIMR